MKQRSVNLSTALLTVLLSVILGFSALMSLSQAYSLDLPLWPTLAFCAGTALILSLLMLPRRSWPWNLAAAVLYLGVLIWQRGPMEQSLGYVLYRISYEFSFCYDDVQLLGLEQGSAVLLLWALAVPLIWVPVWVCSREGSALLVYLLYAPVFLLVLTIVDLAPVFWLILLTGGLLVLLVSQHIRERSAEEGSRLSWWLILPTIILVSGITVLWPPADYVRSQWTEDLRALTEEPERLEQQLQTQVQELLPDRPAWNRGLKSVDLTKEGPKAMTGQPVLDYWADTKISYLRGTSLAIYEDNAWKAPEEDAYEAEQFSENPLLVPAAAPKSLRLQTRGREPLLYTAYAPSALPEGARTVEDAYLQNTAGVRDYEISYLPGNLTTVPQGYDAFVARQYLQLPAELREPLHAIAAQQNLTDVESVLHYVRNCAAYDLMTPRVPADEEFVLYFLEQSHRGYCVHFATAAVLLLRSIDIPARYVTGFAVSGPPGQWQTVTMDDAHAWAEYYAPGFGWIPIEPTPAAADQPEPVPEPTEPPTVPDTPAPVQPETPQIQTPTTPEAPKDGNGAGKELLLLLLPGLLLLILARRLLICGHRRKRCRRGRANRRALTYWHWLEQLCRVQSQVPEEELLCLAEKARFSQHTLEEAELDQLRQAVDAKIRDLKQESFGKRLWYAYGRCLF